MTIFVKKNTEDCILDLYDLVSDINDSFVSMESISVFIEK